MTASKKLTSHSFLIRPIDKDDLLELTTLDRLSRGSPWTKEMFQKELELPFSIHATVKDEKELIAFGVVWQVKKLYEKCGFKTVGLRKKFYGNQNAILMQCAL